MRREFVKYPGWAHKVGTRSAIALPEGWIRALRQSELQCHGSLADAFALD